ncbi:MAG: Bro-N domain-containing protein [Fibromonadales bacterium]|nr:Bro-N domain-containing protein [Fibromonadales bacterium]
MDSNKIQLFENRKVRSVWDAEKEEWFFSVVDVVAVLTEQATQRGATFYWGKLKQRLKEEGSELLTNCQQLKLEAADGKNYLTDVATTEQLFRIIQSIPSPKAEPFKLWLAKVGNERLNQMQDPEKSIKQAMQDYKNLGYSDNWINQRLKSIEVRKELTDEWKNKGLKEEAHFAALTDIITKTWSGKTTKEYKQFKNLKKESLRDNMTNAELVLNMLAEISTKSISESSNPKTMKEHKVVARRGGNVAKAARKKLEKETGRKAISSLNAKTGILTTSR